MTAAVASAERPSGIAMTVPPTAAASKGRVIQRMVTFEEIGPR
jgi:hypothetical protein